MKSNDLSALAISKMETKNEKRGYMSIPPIPPIPGGPAGLGA